MHFWRANYFETLRDIAAQARAVPEWADYAAFCDEYERGLRSKAFAILEHFMSSLECAPFVERQRFVSWLSRHADRRDGRHMLIPHQLHVRIVEPTLLEWTLVEPRCAEPHLWLGGYDHLRRAFDLEPDNQLARRKLIILVWGRVDFEAYEFGYLGNIDKDLAVLGEVEELLKGLTNEEDRRRLAGPCGGPGIDRGALAEAARLLGSIGTALVDQHFLASLSSSVHPFETLAAENSRANSPAVQRN